MNNGADIKAEIIAELNEKPVGRYRIRKCLTKATDENGRVTYSIREYTPRPFIGEAKRYVPARGVNVSENNLRDICEKLRDDLHYMIHAKEFQAEFERRQEKHMKENDSYALSEEGDKELEEIDRETEEEVEAYMDEELDEIEKHYQEQQENEDPDIDGDYEYELDCEDYGAYPSMKNDDGEDVVLSTLAWHGRDGMFDIRVWTEKVNSRGFCEFTPEIDKGIQLDDVEALVLCQEIEKLFPDLLAETGEYAKEDYTNKLDGITFSFTEEERSILSEAVDRQLERQLQRNIIRNNRGSDIGQIECSRQAVVMRELSRKVKEGERLTDKECDSLCDILLAEREFTNDGKEYTVQHYAYNTIIKILNERDRLPRPEHTKRSRKQVSLSKGECEVASQILSVMRDELYNSETKSEHQQQIIDEIDALVRRDIESRNKDRVQFGNAYKKDTGKHFFDDLIAAFNESSTL